MTVATPLVVDANDVNVVVAANVVVIVAVVEVAYMVEVGVFVDPGLTIDMYTTAASSIAPDVVASYRKSRVIIPGDIDVTGMLHITVPGPDETNCPGIEQVTVEVAPFVTGNVTVGVRVELTRLSNVPGIAKKFVFDVAYA